jgi:uncharacterized protein (UPF0548 family)
MSRMQTGDGPEPSPRLAASAQVDPTYPEIGASTGPLPVGYRHVRRSRSIGTGAAAFDSAADQLLSWNVHRQAGLGVEAPAASAALGSTIVLRVEIGPLRIFAPCRVVAVIDEPRQRGFAYGTLPGHPETGEELFVVTRSADDQVHFHISAFSRPSTWWARIGGPVTRRVQDLMTDRYVTAASGI